MIVDDEGFAWYAGNVNARIGRLWLSQTGSDKKLFAFDSKTEKFVAVEDVSDVVRHVMYDAKTDAMWFGTDANRIGRVITRRAVR